MRKVNNLTNTIAKEIVREPCLALQLLSRTMDGKINWRALHAILSEAFALHQFNGVDGEDVKDIRALLLVSADHLIKENEQSRKSEGIPEMLSGVRYV